jgi:hypothetical protein
MSSAPAGSLRVGGEIVVVDLARDAAAPLQSNYFHFGNGCLRIELALLEYVPDVLRHGGNVNPEEVSDLLLSRPNRLMGPVNI